MNLKCELPKVILPGNQQNRFEVTQINGTKQFNLVRTKMKKKTLKQTNIKKILFHNSRVQSNMLIVKQSNAVLVQLESN